MNNQTIKKKITDTYKLDKCYSKTQTNNVTAKFTSKLNIEDRMGKMISINVYILTSPIFMTKKQCRFITPSKTKLGIIFKNSYQKYCIEY